MYFRKEPTYHFSSSASPFSYWEDITVTADKMFGFYAVYKHQFTKKLKFRKFDGFFVWPFSKEDIWMNLRIKYPSYQLLHMFQYYTKPLFFRNWK
jgi:hypothetical protein